MAGGMMIPPGQDPNSMIESLKSMLHDTANRLQNENKRYTTVL